MLLTFNGNLSAGFYLVNIFYMMKVRKIWAHHFWWFLFCLTSNDISLSWFCKPLTNYCWKSVKSQRSRAFIRFKFFLYKRSSNFSKKYGDKTISNPELRIALILFHTLWAIYKSTKTWNFVSVNSKIFN